MINKYTLLITTLMLPFLALPAAHSDTPKKTNGPLMSQQVISILFDTCLKTQNPRDIDELTYFLGTTKDIYTKYEHSFLIEAMRKNKLAVAKAIIEKCPHYCAAKEKCYNEDGEHPLHYLVAGEASPEDPLLHECIDLLAPYVNLLDDTGETSLMCAKHPEIAAHLIARGADVHALSDNNCTALSHHTALTNVEMVEFLRPLDEFSALPERKEHLSQIAQDTLELQVLEFVTTNRRAEDTALRRLLSLLQESNSAETGEEETNEEETPELGPNVIFIFDEASTRGINDARITLENADQIVDLIQKPVKDADRRKATNLIKKYLGPTSKHFLQRDTDARDPKRSRRS